MKAGVVNVLISYVLQINNQKFTRSYIETVASQWSRLNIETVEDAMRAAEKEHKKIKKLTEKKRDKYFDIIMEDAVSVGLGIVDAKTIDEINIK